jgi:hypothetical protein
VRTEAGVAAKVPDVRKKVRTASKRQAKKALLSTVLCRLSQVSDEALPVSRCLTRIGEKRK